MEVRRVQNEDKRHQDLDGGDRRKDRGADPAGEAEPCKSLFDHAGCLIAWTWAVKRYPPLLIVLMIAGSRGSASIFLLSRLICTSMLRSTAALDRPFARSSNWSRVSTRWGLATKAMSRSNSPLVMSTIAPVGERRTRPAGSSRHSSNSYANGKSSTSGVSFAARRRTALILATSSRGLKGFTT